MRSNKALIAVLVLLTGAVGCGRSDESAPPPTPDSFVKHIQANPNMSAEQKAAAIETIRSHQGSGQIAGEARQKRVPPH